MKPASMNIDIPGLVSSETSGFWGIGLRLPIKIEIFKNESCLKQCCVTMGAKIMCAFTGHRTLIACSVDAHSRALCRVEPGVLSLYCRRNHMQMAFAACNMAFHMFGLIHIYIYIYIYICAKSAQQSQLIGLDITIPSSKQTQSFSSPFTKRSKDGGGGFGATSLAGGWPACGPAKPAAKYITNVSSEIPHVQFRFTKSHFTCHRGRLGCKPWFFPGVAALGFSLRPSKRRADLGLDPNRSSH